MANRADHDPDGLAALDECDPNVEGVRAKLSQRATDGLRKYGVDTTRGDLGFAEWLTHLQEELMDGAVYAERLLRDSAASIERIVALLEAEADLCDQAIDDRDGRDGRVVRHCVAIVRDAARGGRDGAE